MLNRPSEAESLQLISAFWSVTDPDKRRQVVELARRFAEDSQVVERTISSRRLDLPSLPEE